MFALCRRSVVHIIFTTTPPSQAQPRSWASNPLPAHPNTNVPSLLPLFCQGEDSGFMAHIKGCLAERQDLQTAVEAERAQVSPLDTSAASASYSGTGGVPPPPPPPTHNKGRIKKGHTMGLVALHMPLGGR